MVATMRDDARSGPERSSRTRPPARAGDTPPFGLLLREWRTRRRRSQLDLALDAEVSTRHLSYVETGRSLPSREMVLRLAERLDVPLRERNALLMAAGFAPMYRERALDDPALAAARQAVDLVLRGLEPCPALAADRHWHLVAHNAVMPIFLEGIDPALLTPPINVLRLSLHPQGLAPRIANLSQWRAHLLLRLQQQIALTADPVLSSLRCELDALPGVADHGDGHAPGFDPGGVVVPMLLRHGGRMLSFFTTTTIFGTPVDITLSELAIEVFFPADAGTAAALRAFAPADPPSG